MSSTGTADPRDNDGGPAGGAGAIGEDHFGDDGTGDVRAPDVFARACPSRQVLENIAGKWGVLALAALGEGGYRFNALRRRVDGVSEKMLAQTLQSLARDGLVRREVRATIPPRVEYSLTPSGARVAGKLWELIAIVQQETPRIRK
jgi:DNA-binding HxlR family transcriptional regulator